MKASHTSKLSPALKKQMAWLGREIVRELIKYETATGGFDPTPENIRSYLSSLVKQISTGQTTWHMATDYRASLLRLAREAKKNEDWEMSCLYYGTWLEHQLNNLIHLWLVRKGGNNRSATIMMKGASLDGKLLWLHLCVAGRIAPIKQLDRLTALNERRNQFVHYKWTMHKLDMKNDHTKRAAEAAENLVHFLNRFESKYFYKNKKLHLKREIGPRTLRRPTIPE